MCRIFCVTARNKKRLLKYLLINEPEPTHCPYNCYSDYVVFKTFKGTFTATHSHKLFNKFLLESIYLLNELCNFFGIIENSGREKKKQKNDKGRIWYRNPVKMLVETIIFFLNGYYMLITLCKSCYAYVVKRFFCYFRINIDFS